MGNISSAISVVKADSKDSLYFQPNKVCLVGAMYYVDKAKHNFISFMNLNAKTKTKTKTITITCPSSQKTVLDNTSCIEIDKTQNYNFEFSEDNYVAFFEDLFKNINPFSTFNDKKKKELIGNLYIRFFLISNLAHMNDVDDKIHANINFNIKNLNDFKKFLKSYASGSEPFVNRIIFDINDVKLELHSLCSFLKPPVAACAGAGKKAAKKKGKKAGSPATPPTTTPPGPVSPVGGKKIVKKVPVAKKAVVSPVKVPFKTLKNLFDFLNDYNKKTIGEFSKDTDLDMFKKTVDSKFLKHLNVFLKDLGYTESFETMSFDKVNKLIKSINNISWPGDITAVSSHHKELNKIVKKLKAYKNHKFVVKFVYHYLKHFGLIK